MNHKIEILKSENRRIKKLTCSTKSIICCSVVSDVMKLSRSVTTSTQMLQVRSFLGAHRVLAIRQERRTNTAFILVFWSVTKVCIWQQDFILYCYLSLVLKIKAKHVGRYVLLYAMQVEFYLILSSPTIFHKNFLFPPLK